MTAKLIKLNRKLDRLIEEAARFGLNGRTIVAMVREQVQTRKSLIYAHNRYAKLTPKQQREASAAAREVWRKQRRQRSRSQPVADKTKTDAIDLVDIGGTYQVPPPPKLIEEPRQKRRSEETTDAHSLS
jgi:hypothetical protein